MKISIIAAVSKNNVIGKKGKIPWHIPEDMIFFKEKTTGHHIIMGKNTFASIGKPLPNRVNIILSRNKLFAIKGCVILHGMADAIEYARRSGESEVFIIGGGKIYKEAIAIADSLYITKIDKNYQGDTFFPEFEKKHWNIKLIDKGISKGKHNTPYSIFIFTKKVK